MNKITKCSIHSFGQSLVPPLNEMNRTLLLRSISFETTLCKAAYCNVMFYCKKVAIVECAK